MTPERWAAAQQLFEAALAAAPTTRARRSSTRGRRPPSWPTLVRGLLAADADEHAGDDARSRR